MRVASRPLLSTDVISACAVCECAFDLRHVWIEDQRELIPLPFSDKDLQAHEEIEVSSYLPAATRRASLLGRPDDELVVILDEIEVLSELLFLVQHFLSHSGNLLIAGPPW